MNASTRDVAVAPFHPRSAGTVRASRSAILALALASLGLPAAAATLNVAAGAVAVSANGICSLREAIHNANANAQVDNSDCPAGSGTDTLQLAAASIYTLLDADPIDPFSGLPAITSTIVIAGAGATIERSSGLTCFLDGAPTTGEFRLLSASSGSDLTLSDLGLRNGCVDGNNQAFGGAIRSDGRLTLAQVVVDGNRSAGLSGGVHTTNGSGPISISASTFSNNFAGESGGAIFAAPGATMTLIGTTLTGNTAGTGDAGGILNFGSVTLVNSTVTGNTAAGGGGGIRNGDTGTLRLDAVTISSNKSLLALGGGGVSNLGALTVKNSIIGGNIEGSDCTSMAPGSVTALGKNLDTDGSCAALDSAHFTRVSAGQLALGLPLASGIQLPVFGSAVIDAVTDCTRIDGVTALALDQRGVSRPQDGDGSGSAACDIGAVERAAPGGIRHVAGACSLGDAIAAANTDTTVGGCVDGQPGSDLLILDANATLTVADTVRSTLQRGAFAGLPDITSEIVIAAGSGNLIERAAAATCLVPDPPAEFRLFNVRAGGALTLSGLSLRNGCADNGGGVLVLDGALDLIGSQLLAHTARAAGTAFGGAVAVDAASARGAAFATRFEQNQVHGNLASGGAVGFALAGSVQLVNTTFRNNLAAGGVRANGGAVWAQNTSLQTSDSLFEGNQAIAGGSVYGGAYFDIGTGGSLWRSRFVANQALAESASGGAVAMVISTRLTDLVFEGNLVQSADNPGGTAGIAEGGALYTEEPEGASLTRVLFVDNSARGGDGTHGGRATGGGLILGDGTSTLTDVTFENNRAIGGAGTSQPGGDSEGGGLAGDHSTLVNVSFSGNVALAGSSSGAAGGNARGGGARLRSFGTTTTLRQLTVSGNRVQAGTGTGTSAGTAAGGGLHFAFLHAVGSSLLEGNTATVGATTTPSDCADEGSLTSLGYNTVGGSAACGLAGTGDQVGVGSSLLGIGDHGCSVPLPGGACLPTMPVRMSAPALDRGSCFGGNFSRDARSFLRPWDAPGVANAIDGCDAGAYESRDGDADGVEDWVDNCPFVANPTQLDRDLAGLEDAVALWRLDAGQGVNAGDGYGSHHGTLTGNPQWVSGISGSALAFDGVGDGVVIPHDAAFNPGLADGFSVTAWVWLPASQVQTGRTTNLIVGKDQEGGAGFPFPWVLRVFNQTAAAGAIGHLQGARSDGTLTAQVVSTSRIDDDRWHHAAFIKSGSMLEMWVDGVLEASVADATVAATTNTRDVGIGLRLPASAKLDLRGSVDEVLYVADSITGAQVLDLYQRRGLAGDGLGAACDCDDADPTNSSAVCANVFTNGFE